MNVGQYLPPLKMWNSYASTMQSLKAPRRVSDRQLTVPWDLYDGGGDGRPGVHYAPPPTV